MSLLPYESYTSKLKTFLSSAAARSKRYFFYSLHTQLFLTLIALPFSLAWGLPLSWLSLFSTPLFLPFLMCFLFVSSLLFFSEIVGIPNGAIAWLLDQITNIWLSILAAAPDWLLFGCIRPSWATLISIAFITIFSLHIRLIGTIGKSIIALSLILGCALCMLYLMRPAIVHTHIQAPRGSMELIHDHGVTILIDNGILSTARPLWIQYSLIGEIVSTTGSLHIDHLIVKRITKTTIANLAVLRLCIPFSHVYVPDHVFIGACKSSNYSLHVICSPEQITTRKNTFTIQPSKKTVIYEDIPYHPLNIISFAPPLQGSAKDAEEKKK